jgi:hypothetical protein
MSTAGVSKPLSAIDRARVAFEDAERRKRVLEVERRSRERARNITLLSLGMVALTVLVAVSVQQGWFASSGAKPNFLRDDSTKGFVATRTGKVRTPIEGNTCRELQFNNELGRFVAEGITECEQVRRSPSEAQKNAEERFQSIRGNFVR